MILASDIVKDAMRKMGRPSQADLPYQDVLDFTRDIVRERMLDYKLTTRGHTIETGSWTAPTEREMLSATFTGTDNFIPVKIEWRFSGTDDISYKSQVTSYENLDDLRRESVSSLESWTAFYNGFSQIAFSYTLEELATREFRVIFESLDDISLTSLSHNAEMPAILLSLLSDEVALKGIEYVNNNTEEWINKRDRFRESLMMSLARNESRFERLKNSVFGNKKVSKIGYRPRR